MTLRRETLIVATIGALIMLPFLFTGSIYFHFMFDEGGSLLVTRGFTQGLLPYVQFHFWYTPLLYYLNAIFLGLSNTIIMNRLVTFAAAVLGVAGIHILSSDIIETRARFVPPIMYAIAIYPIFNSGQPSVIANTFLIFAAVLMIRGKVFLSGILLALCILAKQNIGIYGILAFGLYLLINKKLKTIFRLGVSILIGLSPYLIYLILTGSMIGFITDVFIMPTHFADSLVNPPSMFGPFIHFSLTPLGIAQAGLRLLYLAPIILYAVMLPGALKKKRLLLILLVCAANYLQFFPNKDPNHFFWGFAPSFILLGYQLKKNSKIATLLLMGYILLAFYAITYYGTSPFLNTQPLVVKGNNMLLVSPGVAQVIDKAVDRIGNQTLFVFGPEDMLYYLTGQERAPALDKSFVQGTYGLEERQAEIISYLNSTKPKIAIISTGIKPANYPLVEDYILQHYEYNETIDNPYSPLAFYTLK